MNTRSENTVEDAVRIALPMERVNSPAHIVRTEDEAMAIAHDLAGRFAPGASSRDRERRLPKAELDEFSQSGLWGITIPCQFGGPGLSFATAAEVATIVSKADSCLGQIPQNHYYMIEALRLDGTDQQKEYFFSRVLRGDRFGNAFVELGTKTVFDFEKSIFLIGNSSS